MPVDLMSITKLVDVRVDIVKELVEDKPIGFLMPGTSKVNLVPAAGVAASLKPLLIVIVLDVLLMTQVGVVGKLTKFLH